VQELSKINLKADGQPAYHPKLLLKIYIYGYLNRIRSSRRLEGEIKRNIEMMWLCAGLTPKYKTIANFRKENSKPLKKVFREFVIDFLQNSSFNHHIPIKINQPTNKIDP